MTDICKRNGIKNLVWSTSKNDRVNHLNGCNMTVHRDYAAKSLPGRLPLQPPRPDRGRGQPPARIRQQHPGGQTTGGTADIKIGDVVEFTGTKHYVSSTAKTASSCKPGKATITALAKAGRRTPTT